MMREIVPENVTVFEAFGDLPGASLLDEELPYVERAVEKRRREFAVEGNANAEARGLHRL